MKRHTALGSTLVMMIVLFASGCTTPFDIGNADPHVSPVDAAKDVTGMLNHTVAWGGLIAASTNLKDSTELQVVGYPLDSEHRPDSDAKSTGRFLVIQPGYLETADYAPGRLITAVGTVVETRTGMVGEIKYVYPVVTASKLRLWPKPYGDRGETGVHFGIGVGIIH